MDVKASLVSTLNYSEFIKIPVLVTLASNALCSLKLYFNTEDECHLVFWVVVRCSHINFRRFGNLHNGNSYVYWT